MSYIVYRLERGQVPFFLFGVEFSVIAVQLLVFDLHLVLHGFLYESRHLGCCGCTISPCISVDYYSIVLQAEQSPPRPPTPFHFVVAGSRLGLLEYV